MMIGFIKGLLWTTFAVLAVMFIIGIIASLFIKDEGRCIVNTHLTIEQWSTIDQTGMEFHGIINDEVLVLTKCL